MRQANAVLNPAAGYMYSTAVHELFTNLQHAKVIAETQVQVTVGSIEQGAAATWYARMHNAAVAQVGYQAYGCPYFLAGCESLARWLEGRAVNELRHWRWQELETALTAPAAKRSRWLLLEDAVIRLAKGMAVVG
jgi:NifU-like protein involved in Fe-S cluster formation